jgi:iron complex transport system substrate-binding protein
MRICSLLPSATEIAFALGLGNDVVGVTHECDYPPEARTKPVVVHGMIDSHTTTSRQIDQSVREHCNQRTSLYAIDFLRLKEARPDIVLTQALCEVCALDYNEVVHACQSLPSRPEIIALNPTCLADVLADIKRVGNLTRRVSQAEALVSRLWQRVDEIRAKTFPARWRPRVACLEWLDPIFSAGHWIPEMVDLAGGINGLAQPGETSVQIPWDRVLELNPDVLVLMPCGFDVERTRKEANALRELPGWGGLPAVKTGRVFAVNGHAYFSRSGPRLIDGLDVLSRIIQPEIFSWDVTPEAAQRVL